MTTKVSKTNKSDKTISFMLDKKATEQSAASQKKSFNFDKIFQEKIVQAMLIDRIWCGQFAEVVDVDFFEYSYLRKIAATHLDYYAKYKEFPSTYLLAQMIVTELKHGSDAALKDQVKQFLLKVEENKELSDLNYVKEKSLEFCKKAGLQKALIHAVELIEVEKHEKIVDVIKAAISAGEAQSHGLDLAEDVEARYSETYRKTVSTGIEEFDQRKILNGGLGAGELGVVVAPTSMGKSHMLVQLGSAAILQGKNVLHYTFELNERATGIRYDSNILGIDSTDCHEAKELIKKYYEDNVETLGRLKVKYYPTGLATVQTFRSHIDKLSVNGFRPDVIIVDYAGIMRSTEKSDLLRLELKKICEDLRSFANEMDVPVWTAIQSNKEGANQEIIDLTNMAEAYGQAHVADFVLGLTRNKATGYGTIYIAKNRAGVDGIQYKIHMDTARSKLRIVTDDEFLDKFNGDTTSEIEEQNLKTRLRQRIRDFQKKN